MTFSDSSFNLVVLDLNLRQFISTRYSSGRKAVYTELEGSWSDYHDLPAKRINAFAIEPAFQNMLEDPGAFLGIQAAPILACQTSIFTLTCGSSAMVKTVEGYSSIRQGCWHRRSRPMAS